MVWRNSWSRRWKPYVPVERRQAQAARKLKALKRDGRRVEPILIEGRAIVRTFWGQSWCENLERYSDFANRLPRGRTYVRNGSVIDLSIESGRVKALVSGSRIYDVSIKFTELVKSRWGRIKTACAGKIDSVIELLEGKLSRGVMEVLTSRETGLFPSPREIEMKCSCPDWAVMCKHVAAVLYGVGARLDSRPDLLFVLRGVDQAELVKRAVAGAARLGGDAGESMDRDEMEKLFGIEIEGGAGPAVASGEIPEGAKVREAPGSSGAESSAVGRAVEVPEREEVPPASPRRRSVGRRAPAEKAGSLKARIPSLRRHFRGALSLNNSDYRRLFSVDMAAATRELGELTASGVLVRLGQKRGTRYQPGRALGAR
jgi:uncharacterized Zn finger protein